MIEAIYLLAEIRGMVSMAIRRQGRCLARTETETETKSENGKNEDRKSNTWGAFANHLLRECLFLFLSSSSRCSNCHSLQR